MRVKHDVDTKLIFQIGDPLDHAISAFTLNTMYDLANVNAVCENLVVKKGQLPDFVDFIRKFDMPGFNITMPHKSDVIPLLDECDEKSRIFNSVNNVKNVDGKLIGIGLDGIGMGGAIANELGDLTGKTALMLGAGSICGPIAANLCDRGVTKVHIANRTVEKAAKIAKTIEEIYKIDTSYGPLNDEYLSKVAAESDIVVQCTSMGMAGSKDQYESLEFMTNLPKDAFCADALYPTTPFLEKASALGLKSLNGIAMLLHQMLATVEFRFGIKLSPDCLKIAEDGMMCAVALRELREKRECEKNK